MWWIRSIRSNLGIPLLREDEGGQSLIIVVLAIIALFAIIGLGVDLGLAYVERVRLARAMDAAALAGAQELPAEEAAHLRALEYLDANDYHTANACIETIGSGLGEGSCEGSSAETRIWIDTYQFRDGGEENTANKIQVRAEREVSLAFMRVIGFDTVPVGASATAENIEDLDIVIVYDRSGSMQEDTRCYGCWEPHDTDEYRAGSTYPLPFTVVPTTGLVIHCQESNPLEFQGYKYLSIEAEHYSSYLTEADYHSKNTEYPKIWWSMQRQPGVNASGPDDRGAFMMVGPHSLFATNYNSIADIVHPPGLLTTPRLDYDFTVPESGTYYVWMRAQGGAGLEEWGNMETRRRVHVGLNGTPVSTGETPNHGPYGSSCDAYPEDRGCAADPDKWSWSRVLELPDLNGPGEVYTLNFWAAGPGFSLDKIVITNDPRDKLDRGNRPLDWTYYTVEDGGPGETHGRTGWACLGEEDPRFAPVYPPSEDPDDLDDLYDDYQPIRAAKEAAKSFVRRLDPKLDQIGYVVYSDEAEIKEELYCLKQLGGCEDFESVIDVIETTFAKGFTNIADAMWDGMRVLTTGREPDFDPDGKGFPPKKPGTAHYGRPSAAHIMILMTDGQANRYPKLPKRYGNCYSDDLWPDQPDESEDQARARECVVWFAHQARDRGVVIYTIGLGAQADNELLEYVADITGGLYRYAPKAEDLNAIFEELYENIFLRLIE